MNGQTAKKHAKAIRITKKTLLSILIWAGGIIMVFPFLWMVSASFKGINEVFNFPIEWIPKNPTLKGYELLLKGDVPFITYFLNSVKIALISLIGTFFACTMAGYAYAKIDFKGRDKLFLLKLMTTMIPSLVTILPTYLLYLSLIHILSRSALHQRSSTRRYGKGSHPGIHLQICYMHTLSLIHI